MLKDFLLKYTMIIGLTFIFCYIAYKFECWNAIIIYLLILNLVESKDGINCKYFKYKEHNNRYLTQCYYNLQEKYDRGIISEEEWQKITKHIGDDI